jgi:pimeloyl-ACP methyl ester carboxylesterase
MDHCADDLAALAAHLDLKNAVHVGHTTGGEVTIWLGMVKPGDPGSADRRGAAANMVPGHPNHPEDRDKAVTTQFLAPYCPVDDGPGRDWAVTPP